ncbi:MAG: tetratricopeptide repeat protein [Bacteroidales bacterium]|nr:tetratricopeptide repeat protein [Bacteroidales bacterium]
MKINKFNATLISLVLALFLMAGNVQAQKKFVNKAVSWAEKGENLDTAMVLLDMALENEKTKDWAKTYYARGLVFKAVFSTENEEFKSLSEEPLIDAMDNFKKALVSNGVAAIETYIHFSMAELPEPIYNLAIESYENKDFKRAFMYFKETFELKQLDLFGATIDTALLYNTALMAQLGEDYENAIKYYNQAIGYNYGGGETYAYLADIYKTQGDSESYLQTLKDGFEKYPGTQAVLGSLINYYIFESENSGDALTYLDYAIETDPNNAFFYSGKAMVYDKLGQPEEAIKMYKKSIEINPDLVEAYFNLGVIYFNEGVELSDKAVEIKDNNKYEIAKVEADNKFKEALPYLEKAFEYQQDDTNIGKTLRTLYYRLQMTEKYEEITKKLEE